MLKFNAKYIIPTGDESNWLDSHNKMDGGGTHI